MQTGVFNTVIVQTGGTWVPMSIEDFFALPLSTRIRHVIDRTVAFQLDGESVDQKDALAALRLLRVERKT